MQSDNPIPLPTDADAVSANVLPFYGNKGKRAAVELFLSRLCATGRSHTLLLYSDEDMSWLYEDAAFRSRWAALLVRILTLGGSIKMIHTVSRNATDSFEREFWNYYALCRPLMHVCRGPRDAEVARAAARSTKRKTAAALAAYINALPKPAQDWNP